jgi:hypothetical protein
MDNIKITASQAKSVNSYKNIRTKLLQCCANIYFNKQCVTKRIIPTYAKIKVPYTSPASGITQHKVQTLRIKDEIRFPYRKKEQLNTQLYRAHIGAANEWGPVWNMLSQPIHDNINTHMEKKIQMPERKLKKLTQQQTNNHTNAPNFYPRVVNNTNIVFNEDENVLLRKGLKYKLHFKPKQWIHTLAMEAETAVTLLPALDQDPIRYQVARNLERLLRQTNGKTLNITHTHSERKVLNRIREKLKNNYARITKADKGNSIGILYEAEYNSEVETFLTNNSFQIEFQDPTKLFQTEVRKNINSCNLIIPTDRRWKYINLNPSPPNLRGLVKIHKPNAPIRPIINWRNAPAYELAKLISDKIKHEISLPFTFNVQNSIQLMTELHDILYTSNVRLASFDIKGMYTNISTTKVPHTYLPWYAINKT